MEPCLFGLVSKSDCHKTWYSRKPGLTLLSSFSKTEIELLIMRSQKNLTSEDVSTKSICLHHHAFFCENFLVMSAKIAVIFLAFIKAKDQKVLVKSI